MEKLARLIVKYKKPIFILVIIMVIAGILGTVFVVLGGKINSDMLEYLPKKTATGEAIDFLKETFDIEGDAFVVVEGSEDDYELGVSVSKLKKIKGVTQFVWYGDVVSMEKLIEIAGDALPMKLQTEDLKQYLRQPIYDGTGKIISYNYVLLVLFEYSPSTQEAFDVHAQIREELGTNLGRSVALSGMTGLADTVMSSTMKEIPYYLIFSVIVVIIILFLATDSFVDPLVLIITMGVSVLINMGTNYLLPSISIVSFAASSVLQLGITMDYAIFLLNAYKEDRLLFCPTEAVGKALPRTIISVLASGLTTMGGFAAMYFMRFSIGADLANVIIKGVAMSLITVILLQPCLMIVFDKLMQKTKHKTITLNSRPLIKTTLKARWIIAIAACLLLVPAFFGQMNVKFSYLKIYEPKKEQTAQEILAEKLQNQVIMAVPLDTKNGTHKEFMAELIKDEKISNVLGAYSALDADEDSLKSILSIPALAGVPLVKMLFSENDGKIYTLYLVTIEGDTEDKAAFATYDYLSEKLNYYFDESYPLGVLTGTADMASITPEDFLRVALASAVIIFLIMAILLKSVFKSAMMVVLIELAIWVNISINTIFGIPINFMIYLIISSMQLGCTVDYAILMNMRFEEKQKQGLNTVNAIVEGYNSALPAITTSAAIISGTCLTVYFISNNLLVKEMGMMLARGAAISYLMVILVLPCLLVFFKKLNRLIPNGGNAKNGNAEDK